MKLLRIILLALLLNGLLLIQPAPAESPKSVTLSDIESGSPDPTGNYRWMDVADQLYAGTYQNSYNYTQASVQVNYYTGGASFHGSMTAANLKPHFAYQLKLVGIPESAANERIGLAGRWWQEEWNGSEWANGTNLNNKGDGSFPNPNDDVYLSRRDIPDPTSPTGKHYRYTGYLVFGYFITDAAGSAVLNFEANSSFHVLWKTTQRTRTTEDGPLKETAFEGGNPDPVDAYDVLYSEKDISIFGEWERLPVGAVFLSPGQYEAQLVLTEESFHGSGPAGSWAGAVSGVVTFQLVDQDIPALSGWSATVLILALLAMSSGMMYRRRSRATKRS